MVHITHRKIIIIITCIFTTMHDVIIMAVVQGLMLSIEPCEFAVAPTIIKKDGAG